jgi:hypothetical protein
MYAMNIQNDVIGLVLRENCKSKQICFHRCHHGIPQAFVFFRFVDIIVITIHDRFWNDGQANSILKYFENMMMIMSTNRKNTNAWGIP